MYPILNKIRMGFFLLGNEVMTVCGLYHIDFSLQGNPKHFLDRCNDF